MINIKDQTSENTDFIECQNTLKTKQIEILNLKKLSIVSIEKCENLIYENIVDNSSCLKFDKLSNRFLSICKKKNEIIIENTSSDSNTEINKSKEDSFSQFITSMASSHRNDDIIDKESMFKKLNKVSESSSGSQITSSMKVNLVNINGGEGDCSH